MCEVEWIGLADGGWYGGMEWEVCGKHGSDVISTRPKLRTDTTVLQTVFRLHSVHRLMEERSSAAFGYSVVLFTLLGIGGDGLRRLWYGRHISTDWSVWCMSGEPQMWLRLRKIRFEVSFFFLEWPFSQFAWPQKKSASCCNTQLDRHTQTCVLRKCLSEPLV